MRVFETFVGVSGECGSFLQGSWCFFLRLAGCNLRCKWCDTARSQEMDSGTEMSVEAVVKLIEASGLKQVLITGGEPLLQLREVEELIIAAPSNYAFQIETNGSILPYSNIWTWATLVFDYKLPSSGMMEKMNLPDMMNYKYPHWIKFVIADEKDYLLASSCPVVLEQRVNTAFSACPPLTHNQLFRWMKRDKLYNVVQSIQIHKLADLKESQK